MTDELANRVRDALRVVIDPELGENIVDLGFIYDISVVRWRRPDNDDRDHARMPGEPFPEGRRGERAARVPGVGSVDVVMTFDPPWAPSRIAPAVRASLGFAAVN